MPNNRKHRKKRQKHSILPWLAAIAVLAAALALLLVNVVFVVRDVRVAGAGEIPDNEVVRLSGIRFGARLNSVDAERVRLDVESDGRLAFVDLEPRLPGTIELTVRQRTQDALILQAGKVLVLDSDAYVVSVSDSLPSATMPYVTGLRANYYALGRQLDTADGRCAAMKAVLEALKAQNATGYAAELSVADTSDIRVITRTGMTVLLGDAGNMEAKVAWMAGALADLESRGETGGRLDVSSGTKADYRPPESDAEPAQDAAAEAAQAAPAGS